MPETPPVTALYSSMMLSANTEHIATKTCTPYDAGSGVSDSSNCNEMGIPVGARALRLAGQFLLVPDSGLLTQGTRFALAGGTVMAVYVGITTLLASVFGVPFQAALAIGFVVALTVHFNLQRLFVWTHLGDFALPLHHQLGRYLLLSATQYAVTVASTSLLPSALGLSAEVVYLGTMAVILSLNFVVFRHRIFHAKKPAATN